MSTLIQQEVLCYHCGQHCEETITSENKVFCCVGCRAVFEILNENGLCEYYSLDQKPGISLRSTVEASFAYLDDAAVRKKLLEFDSPYFARIKFFIPSIHCVSCIWLLENFQRIQNGVLRSEVNFSSRKVVIDFNPSEVGLGLLAQMLASLGYAPQINLGSEAKSMPRMDKSLVVKLAIAGFAFGNIMLLSFPEYLGLDDSDAKLRILFSYLNVTLTIPVLAFSARDYFINAWKSFSQKQINIDVPIALGLFALASRSIYDIFSGTGPGYLDSLSGLVFFLLIGRWFQGKTYETLAFDRDYKSYFPLAAQKFVGAGWQPVIIYDLEPGDRIKVRNLEIVPADCTLISESAFIDYSFVTGESRPVKVIADSHVYAGGRLVGQPIELVVTKKTSQGHLTGLWNNPIFQKPKERAHLKAIDLAAARFTWVVLILAAIVTIAWYAYDPSRVWLILTSVLMVACPCALALAAPFTFGSFLRSFGRNGLYLKNSDVVERLAAIDAVVFDKTGTITFTKQPNVRFIGGLDKIESSWIKTLTGYSTHPLSTLINKSLSPASKVVVTDFREYPGRGIAGEVDGHTIKIGSASFVGTEKPSNTQSASVFVSIDAEPRGFFTIETSTRKNLGQMIGRLGAKCVALISGDDERDRGKMAELFGKETHFLFEQSPVEKMDFVKSLQREGKKVMMVGDGLNDAGALKQSDVGIAVTDDTAVFTPACDGIMRGDALQHLDRFLKLAKYSSAVLRASFVISFSYNAITLAVAASGNLTPLVAAILMPISSITVVGFSTLSATYLSGRTLNNPNPA
jgi:Cu+-exporting ATPase